MIGSEPKYTLGLALNLLHYFTEKNTLAQFETLIVYLWPSATEHNKRFSEIVSLNESALLASVLILSHS